MEEEMATTGMEDADKYYKEMEKYVSQDFFSRDDRKISFYLGRYYSQVSYYEKEELKTTSLLTKMPIYTNRLDKQQIIKIMDKCNAVVKRLISKHKSSGKTAATMRGKLNELLAKDCWESNHEELSLAFMMGYTFFVKNDEKKNQG